MKNRVILFVLILSSGCFGPTGKEQLQVKLRTSDNQMSSEDCGYQIGRIITDRLHRHGLSDSDFEVEVVGGTIELMCQGLLDAERTVKLISATGKLEFWETYENEEVYGYLAEANKRLVYFVSDTLIQQEVDKNITSNTGILLDQFGTDSLQDINDLADFNKDNPLFAILSPAASSDGLYSGPVIGYAAVKDTALVNSYFKLEQIARLFPRDLKMLWTHKPINQDDPDKMHQLVAIKVTNRNGSAPLDGSCVAEANMDYGQFDNSPEITMKMDEKGGEDWQRLTATNINRSIALVVDDEVYSFPTVMAEISGGMSSITGNFTVQEANDLAIILNSKPYPCRFKILEKNITSTP